MNEYVVLTKAIHTKIRSVWVLHIVTSMEQACCRTFFTDRLLLLLFCPGKAKVTPENICGKKKRKWRPSPTYLKWNYQLTHRLGRKIWYVLNTITFERYWYTLRLNFWNMSLIFLNMKHCFIFWNTSLTFSSTAGMVSVEFLKKTTKADKQDNRLDKINGSCQNQKYKRHIFHANIYIHHLRFCTTIKNQQKVFFMHIIPKGSHIIRSLILL